MILNNSWCCWTGEVRRIFCLRCIWMIALILKEGLTYLFVIMYASLMRIELTIVRSVTVSLNVICLSSYASIYCCCLTSCTMWVNLFLIKHLHFLSIITVIALWWWCIIILTTLELSILLMTQTIYILNTSWVVSLSFIYLVILI